MANHPDAQLGIALLTARINGNRESFETLSADLTAGEVVGLMMRTAEMMVSMIADLLGQSKEDALKTIALALAEEMD